MFQQKINRTTVCHCHFDAKIVEPTQLVLLLVTALPNEDAALTIQYPSRVRQDRR